MELKKIKEIRSGLHFIQLAGSPKVIYVISQNNQQVGLSFGTTTIMYENEEVQYLEPFELIPTQQKYIDKAFWV